MHMYEQWGIDLTVLVSGSRRFLLSECVYCVAITFKMTEWVEQRICITFCTFCIKLQHSSAEAIQMIQKAAAMSDWQLHHNNEPTHASCLIPSFLAKHQIIQVTQSHYSLELVPCNFRLFPKIKITFEKEEISDHQWDSGKSKRAADWENCVRFQGAYFEGCWGVIVLRTMFLVSSSINVSVFHITWLIPSGQAEYIHIYIPEGDIYIYISFSWKHQLGEW